MKNYPNLLSAFILIVLYSINMNVYAGSWKTKVLCEEIINDRKLTETLHYDTLKHRKLYYYKVSDIYYKVQAIRDSLPSFYNDGQYTEPRWIDYQSEKKETKELCRLAYNLFFPNSKELSDLDMNIKLEMLSTNDGMVYCCGIISRCSLLDVFTAADLVRFFDRLSLFRYTSPLVKHPEHSWRDFSFFVYQRSSE